MKQTRVDQQDLSAMGRGASPLSSFGALNASAGRGCIYTRIVANRESSCQDRPQERQNG